MKHKTLTSVLAGIAAASILFSCAKETPENTWPANTSSNGALDNFFAQHAPASQSFQVNAQSGGFLYGTGGTQILIYPNAFIDQNGNPVSGNVDIHLVEVLNKRAAIYAGASTTCNGRPIESDGEVWIDAWQGNQMLSVVPGSVTLGIPTANPVSGMQAFFTDRINGGRDFTLDSAAINVVPDSSSNSSQGALYTFQIDSMGWWNCDRFMGQGGPEASFSVSLPALYDYQNTMVIVSFDGYFAFAQLYYYDDPGTFHAGSYYKLPEGMNVTFAAISEINGQFYYGSQSVTIGSQNAISIVPALCTEAQVDQYLSNLP